MYKGCGLCYFWVTFDSFSSVQHFLGLQKIALSLKPTMPSNACPKLWKTWYRVRLVKHELRLSPNKSYQMSNCSVKMWIRSDRIGWIRRNFRIRKTGSKNNFPLQIRFCYKSITLTQKNCLFVHNIKFLPRINKTSKMFWFILLAVCFAHSICHFFSSFSVALT